MKTLKCTSEVIAALGGNSPVAELFGVLPSAVSNWRGNGRFPGYTFDLFSGALRKAGKRADGDLWRFERKRHSRPPATDARESI